MNQSRKRLFIASTMAVLFLISNCSSNSDTIAATEDQTVSTQVETSMDAISDAMDGINNSGQSNLSYYKIRQYPINKSWYDNALQKISDTLIGEQLHAAFSCGSGSVSRSPTTPGWGTSASFDVTRTFSDCAGARFTLAGTTEFQWSGLTTTGSAPYLQTNSKMLRAPSLTITRTATGRVVTVEGNGSTISNNKVSHTLTWTAVDTSANTRSFTIDIDVTRTAKSSAGATLFKHTVKSTTALTVAADLTAKTRTISAGVIKVTGALGLTTATTQYSNVVYNIDTCKPQSGSVTTTFTGLREGTATVTFNSDGTADYDYTGTNRKAKGTITLKGC